MRITTFNVNGLRSALKKGFAHWLDAARPDVLCLQEVRWHEAEAQVREDLLEPLGYRDYWRHAERPGYSGVALWARREPDRVAADLGVDEFDGEGRLLVADFGRLRVASVYVPSGSSSEERQATKFRFLDHFAGWLESQRKRRRPVVVCGDLNVAHTERDLENWRGNRNHSGFLPEERAWLTRVLESGWVDTWRSLHPDESRSGYTWWSNRGRAREKNVGWRIDYQLATPSAARQARDAWVHGREPRLSDHAPLTVEYGTPPW